MSGGFRRLPKPTSTARRSKTTYSKHAKAAKAKSTQVKRVAKSKPGSKSVKKLVVANAKAIASLKQSKYGTLQRCYSKMEGQQYVHITENYPACLHLNSLYCGQTNEPPVKWIQANQQYVGAQQPVMDDYTLVNAPFKPMGPRMIDHSEIQPRPNGPEILWLSTTLKFQFTAWVPETYVDIYIVQQRTAKHVPDPWRTEHQNSDHADTYLPYLLPQWNKIGSKPMSGNWIDRSQYKVITHRKVWIDSIADVPPGFLEHTTGPQTLASATFAAAATVVDTIADSVTPAYGVHGAAGTKTATTNADRFVNITIKPNMVVKQLKSATGADNIENLAFSANAAENKTEGPWSYDNIDPKQNLWCIVTTSDPGHDATNQNHRVVYTCHRTNTWRDLNDTDGLASVA